MSHSNRSKKLRAKNLLRLFFTHVWPAVLTTYNLVVHMWIRQQGTA